MIPVFNKVIYPLLSKLGINLKPLPRMTIGMILTATSFVCSGLIQILLNNYDLFVFWQIPQYWILGCGEIMVSITGLEFAYSQSPVSTKSIVMAGWLMTTAIGNVFVAVIAETNVIGK